MSYSAQPPIIDSNGIFIRFEIPGSYAIPMTFEQARDTIEGLQKIIDTPRGELAASHRQTGLNTHVRT
jgi:hypothetical protein